jgi:hypothetical protein
MPRGMTRQGSREGLEIFGGKNQKRATFALWSYSVVPKQLIHKQVTRRENSLFQHSIQAGKFLNLATTMPTWQGH